MSFVRSKKFIVLILILVIGLGGYRWFSKKNEKKYEMAVVKRGEVRQELVLSGEVMAEEKVDLMFQSSGRLAWVGVKEGDRVNKYQAIASLDVRQLKKTLKQKLNLYTKERWTFDQQRYDYRDNVLDDEVRRVLDKGQKDLDNSVIDVELQDIALRYSTLVTPIAGIVTRVDAPYSGVNILYTATKFQVVNPDTVYFEVNADQTEVVDIFDQQKVKIVLDAFPDVELVGVVDRISYVPEIGESGTVYGIKVRFQDLVNDDFVYRLGMTGDATFVIDKKEGTLFVPLQFVKVDDKGKYLLVGDSENKVYVKTGIENDEVVEINGDVNEGDTIFMFLK